ncbi:MAG: hypothetical protein PHI12_07745 [Dehalococcoidales bacterium]|nr:hypothetical protein [Dehalococcoidales bacterium]
MPNWTKVVTNVGIGGAAGVADNLAQSYDEKRAMEYAAANPGKALSMWKQFGTYLNFLAPAAGVAAIAFMRMSDENQMRIALVGGQLAGRKAAHRWWKVTGAPVSPAPYTRFNRVVSHSAPAPRTYEPEFDAAGTKF